jgi:hypothetical protein
MIAYSRLAPFLSNLPPHLSSAPSPHAPDLLLEARDLLASSTALYTSPLKRSSTVPGALGGATSAGRVDAKYIWQIAHVCMYLSQHTQSAQDVKVRRVRGALRVLAALGVVVAVVVFALFQLVAQPGEAPDAAGAYQYAKLHVTLYGKIAALSHHDVLKTTEPLTCSDGVQNFTCLLSKTDITPILRELRKIDVAPEVSPAARRWVLVLDFNFTEGSWRWRNITVVKGWELKWNNQTTYVFQAQIKKSLGEMVKINKELLEAFLIRRELKNITAVAVYADKIAIATTNGTTTNGKGKPDYKTIERIREYIRKRYGDVIVEVYYTPGATSVIGMAGG